MNPLSFTHLALEQIKACNRIGYLYEMALKVIQTTEINKQYFYNYQRPYGLF